VQLIAEKEILIVVAWLVHCCAIKEERYCCIMVIRCYRCTVHSRERRPLEILQFIQRFNLGNSVPNTVIMLRIVLTIAGSVATCERSFFKLKLVKNYLRSSMSAFEKSCHTVYRAAIDR